MTSIVSLVAIFSFSACGHHVARTLFTSETLDITQYQQNRQNAIENVEQPHRFKWELQCYLENEAEKEAPHLKNAIEVLAHIIESDMNDVELIRKTLYTYGSLPGVTEKAKRSIGNLTMSAIHSVNMADVALQVTEKWKILLNLKTKSL